MNAFKSRFAETGKITVAAAFDAGIACASHFSSLTSSALHCTKLLKLTATQAFIVAQVGVIKVVTVIVIVAVSAVVIFMVLASKYHRAITYFSSKVLNEKGKNYILFILLIENLTLQFQNLNKLLSS